MTAPDGRPEPRALADAEERRRIREDLDQTFVVEAAAGTGKTTALVQRIVATVREGRASLESTVAVTFTDKAAGEMKLRLREQLERERQEVAAGTPEARRLEEALAELEAARIATIHAFCADLLRERPVEAGIDPAFAVLPDDERDVLLGRAFDAWFGRALESPGPGLRRILKRRSWRRDRDDGPREFLMAAVRRLAEWRDHPHPWRRDPWDRDAAIDALLPRIEEVSALGHRADRSDDWLAKDLLEMEKWLREQQARERVRGRDPDGLEAGLLELAKRYTRRWTGGRRKRYGEGLDRPEVLAARTALDEALDRFAAASEADLAPLLREELAPVLGGLADLQRKAGRLDFLDLLLRTRDLLRDQAPVRRELQARYRRIFVDEFQDTDPLQAEILLLLGGDPETKPAGAGDPLSSPVAPGKLFLVGDPKQSIYRFRRADVATYERLKGNLVAQGAEVLYLRTSFRSVPGIQSAVNQAFATAMQPLEDGSQATYVPLEEHRPAAPEPPPVIALGVPAPYGAGRWPTKKAVSASAAVAVAAFVEWLVRESGWEVEDPTVPGAPRVPVETRHVCLLFRRMQSFRDDVTRPYVRALEARGLPHVLVGGRSFHEREEVLALQTVVTALEWPDDDLAVYATLRGPFLGFDDGTLLDARERFGRLHPLQEIDPLALDTDGQREVADALALLRDLHRARNRRPIAETLHRFLDATRAHATVAIWPTGEQALANVLHLVDESRRFEARGATSFRAFVEWLAERAARGSTGEAPVVEEGAEGVRIMTVHKAKGLEFPVVVLCDPTANRTSDRPSRLLDPARKLWAGQLAGCVPRELHEHRDAVLRADDAENVRTAYVAATRARDLLVVPAVGDEPVDGWVDLLFPALYPPRGERRSAGAAPGCPPFGHDTVLERSFSATGSPETSVRPGLYPELAGGHGVVWWDPRTLRLDVPPRGGVQQELLVEDEEGGGSREQAEVAAYREWMARGEATREAGRAPSRTVQTATAVARGGVPGGTREAELAAAVRVESTRAAAEADRPRGRRFGSLVHAALAGVPFPAADAPPDGPRIAALTRAQGRLLGATGSEVEAATRAVTEALAHPVLRRAAAAGAATRRELPLAVRDEARGGWIEGTADLAFPEKDRWVVVDYKTDRRADDGAYRAQLAVYGAALGRAYDTEVVAIVLQV